MSEVLQVLGHSRRLYAALRDEPIEKLEEYQLKLTEVLEKRIAEEEEVRLANAEKLQSIDEIKALIAEKGLDLDDFVGFEQPAKSKSKRAPRPAKYKYTDNEGQERTWTGQGRTPKAIQEKLDQGLALESFEI